LTFHPGNNVFNIDIDRNYKAIHLRHYRELMSEIAILKLKENHKSAAKAGIQRNSKCKYP